ncbi:MAG: hypothetical protein IPG63_03050 [Xanthomonadales bacterium]|nr:hypothetical protein [Xanthomonadales bacterium]
MQTINTIRFALRDRIDDVEVGPARIPLALLGQFQSEVADFLRGSTKDVDPAEVMVSIEEGSLAIIASGLLSASRLWSDLALLHNPLALGLIDPKRAMIVEGWQRAARKNPHRIYSLNDLGGGLGLRIDAGTDFRNQVDAMWIPVEKYLQGQVTDLGGTTKANVHLRLLSGRVVTIAASQELLAAEEKNRLYKAVLLHVGAEENLRTGELRHLRLLSFQSEPVGWNEAEFNAMVEKGTKAWSDVPSTWLEDLRSANG